MSKLLTRIWDYFFPKKKRGYNKFDPSIWFHFGIHRDSKGKKIYFLNGKVSKNKKFIKILGEES